MNIIGQPLLTTVVGSYPQPDWLIDREMLGSWLPPRVRAREIWRVKDAYLGQAQDDATVLAIHDIERAGIDIVSDGEMRRGGIRLASSLLLANGTMGSSSPERTSVGWEIRWSQERLLQLHNADT